MVGVDMKATWTQSRKSNFVAIHSRVSTSIHSWTSGKFMDLVSRPWSLNSYVLSKVCFKCHSVDMRAMDINGITSRVKTWLFQDQFEKPEEFTLHRPISMGGFGLHNVKIKAQSSLIRTFMESAAHPNLQHHLMHSIL